MFDQILEAFPKASDYGVIFSWGELIYNPHGIVIAPALMAHEAVHGKRQAEYGGKFSVEAWWQSYIADPEFRYREELPAHAAEFRVMMPRDRNERARLVMYEATRLIAPLYNYGARYSLNTAIKDLQHAVERR